MKKVAQRVTFFLWGARERVELSCLAAHDFESCVSAIPPPGRSLFSRKTSF